MSAPIYLHSGPRERKITHQQRGLLLDAIREGLRYGDIADAFGITKSAVSYHADNAFTGEQRVEFRRTAVREGRRSKRTPPHLAPVGGVA